MSTEIERRFLLCSDAWRSEADAGLLYRQGYLLTDQPCSLRVRRAGAQAWFTIKGPRVGLGRLEYEYPIPVEHAEHLLDAVCHQPLIEKVRHQLRVAGKLWEIDVFHGANAGLIIAEVELDAEDESIEIPAWAGEEISTEYRYSNYQLALHPWSSWTR